MHKIMVLNLGGTSSKFSIFEDENEVFKINMSHDSKDVAADSTIRQQVVFRTKVAKEWLESIGVSIDEITAFGVRGGGLAEFNDGGTYHLQGELLEACLNRFSIDSKFIHGTQAVVRTALALADDRDIPIFLTDPTTVDEQTPEARVSGHPGFKNIAVFHALNSKAVSRYIAKKIGKPYQDLNLLVAHMGAGTSVSAHRKGKVIDVNNCLLGDGPMSPNRVGNLQIGQLIDWCYSGHYSKEETTRLFRTNGGLKAHLKTDDMRIAEKMVAEGDKHAELILDAYILQVAKEIGARSAALHFEVDGIILTGGIAHSEYITGRLIEYVRKIAPIYFVPGELENQGLASGAYRVLTGQEAPVAFEL